MPSDIIVEAEVAETERLAQQGLAKANELIGKLAELQGAAAKRSFSGTSDNSMATATVNGNGKLVKLSVAPLNRRTVRTDLLSTELLGAIHAARTVAALEVNKRVAKLVPGIVEEIGGAE